MYLSYILKIFYFIQRERDREREEEEEGGGEERGERGEGKERGEERGEGREIFQNLKTKSKSQKFFPKYFR